MSQTLMKLRTSLLLNYAGQFYTTLLGVVLVPVLVRKMGAEAYGLVAFFSTLFAVFYLLDLGLTPMVQREYARFVANARLDGEFLRIWRAFNLVFAIVALVGMTAVAFGADALVYRWIRLSNLSPDVARQAVVWMGVAVSLRWWTGLFRGVISGGEHMAWLSVFNIAIATLRYAGALVWMEIFGYRVISYFVYQTGVALFEWFFLALKAHLLLPKLDVVLGWSLVPLKPLWRMGLAGALASFSGALLIQLDRVILSGILPLDDFGHYTMIVLVANTVMILSAPISAVLMPRMARLNAEEREEEFVHVYRMGTRLTSALVFGGALALAYCAKPILTAWVGEADWAAQYSLALSFYAVGYGMWALGAFSYYLQYARGPLHWHAWGTMGMLFAWGLIVWCAGQTAGATGVSIGWAVLTGAYLLLWTYVVHARYLQGLHWTWFLRDVLFMNWPIGAGMLLATLTGWEPYSRRESLAYVIFVGGALMTMNLAWWAWVERKHWFRVAQVVR